MNEIKYYFPMISDFRNYSHRRFKQVLAMLSTFSTPFDFQTCLSFWVGQSTFIFPLVKQGRLYNNTFRGTEKWLMENLVTVCLTRESKPGQTIEKRGSPKIDKKYSQLLLSGFVDILYSGLNDHFLSTLPSQRSSLFSKAQSFLK